LEREVRSELVVAHWDVEILDIDAFQCFTTAKSVLARRDSVYPAFTEVYVLHGLQYIQEQGIEPDTNGRWNGSSCALGRTWNT
jgi:hypothetical protein